MSRIAIFGAGYVGLVTGACFAELGHTVAIRDVVPEKIDALRAGEVPIFEPGLDELLERNAERLTFTLDVAGYWGIEQTDWADPPLLDKPNRTIVRKGRRFDLYFNGAHLHVVALREPHASYWVTNTLLNKLSNETMLSIARSLAPLGSAK